MISHGGRIGTIVGVNSLVSALISALNESGINSQVFTRINYNLLWKTRVQMVINVSCILITVSPKQDRHLIYLFMA